MLPSTRTLKRFSKRSRRTPITSTKGVKLPITFPALVRQILNGSPPPSAHLMASSVNLDNLTASSRCNLSARSLHMLTSTTYMSRREEVMMFTSMWARNLVVWYSMLQFSTKLADHTIPWSMQVPLWSAHFWLMRERLSRTSNISI
jgi:hypothetical protein